LFLLGRGRLWVIFLRHFEVGNIVILFCKKSDYFADRNILRAIWRLCWSIQHENPENLTGSTYNNFTQHTIILRFHIYGSFIRFLRLFNTILPAYDVTAHNLK
jgi:hypothetical protein